MADLSKIQEVVRDVATSTGVSNLNARANGNLVEIHGTVRSLAEKQRVMRAITNAVGDTASVQNLIQVASDNGRPLGRGGTAIGITQASERPRTHRVAKGETLSHIAQKYYGKASEYRKIFEANRDKLSDPDKVREGIELRIPQ